MKNPKVKIKLKNIEKNTKKIVSIAESKGIQIWGVTKGVSGDLEVAKAMIEGGVIGLADSRIENLLKLKKLNKPLMLLRIPMLSEVKEVVRLINISLNSEIKVIQALDKAAKELKKIHKIILMVDLGDRREGVLPENVLKVVKEIKKLKNIKLIGLGTNMACFRGVLPNEENMSKLIALVNNIRVSLDIDLEIISGGNSSSLPLLLEEKYIPVTNQLRVGETILLGREVPSGKQFLRTTLDTFELVGELVELKEKPTENEGQSTINAFGEKVQIINKGVRKRGIVAIGRQDIVPETLIPINSNIRIEGASSDHLILDLTKIKNIEVGDEVSFNLKYSSLLQVMTSPYVKKMYIKER